MRVPRRVVSVGEAMTDRLLQLLRERAVRRGEVTLASGRRSDWFVDCKQAVLSAEGHWLVGEALLQAIERLPERPVAVAGVELGGCSLASSVALLSHRAGRPLDAIYVRKAPKGHGSRRACEGDDHLPEAAPVVIVEDVLTTGASALRAAQRLRERGLRPVGVVALVDRGEGGGDAVRRAGLPCEALYGRAALLGEG